MHGKYPVIALDEEVGEPQFSFSREIIHVNLPEMTQRSFARVADNPIHVIIGIDAYGMISLEQNTSWYGKKYKGAMSGDDFNDPTIMQHEDRMEVFGWLIEWEMAEWRAIGPEDNELFATKKLADHLRTITEMHW